ncbi:hypothetical protein Tco_0477760 [Tanacetum coccineum]
MTDAIKIMWIAIKSRFGGNDESKKMQKYILKQQFEGFTVSNSDGIHKGYERFQSLLSQLKIHGAEGSLRASSSNLQNYSIRSGKITNSTNELLVLLMDMTFGNKVTKRLTLRLIKTLMVALLPLEVVEDILLGKETSLKEYQSISEENIKGTKTTKETSLKEEEGADRVCIQNKGGKNARRRWQSKEKCSK